MRHDEQLDACLGGDAADILGGGVGCLEVLEQPAAIVDAPRQLLDRGQIHRLVNEHVGLIKHLEEEGDAIYHDAIGQLFAGNPDPLQVLKWKEIYDTLERAIDSCMGVAQVLQSISMKNA